MLKKKELRLASELETKSETDSYCLMNRFSLLEVCSLSTTVTRIYHLWRRGMMVNRKKKSAEYNTVTTRFLSFTRWISPACLHRFIYHLLERYYNHYSIHIVSRTRYSGAKYCGVDGLFTFFLARIIIIIIIMIMTSN